MHQYCTTLTRDFGPLDAYKQVLFTKLIIPHVQGVVADVGSSYTGLYRSLGYAQQATSMSFFDHDQTLLDTLIQIAESCQSEYFSHYFTDTVSRLDTRHIDANYHTMMQTRNTMIDQTTPGSFLDLPKSQYSELFDTILCIESLECVDTEQDLTTACRNYLAMLKSGGKLCLSVLRYTNPDSHYIRHLRSRQHEGSLNPDANLLKKILTDLGCTIIFDEVVDTKHVYGQYGYTEAVLMVVRKK